MIKRQQIITENGELVREDEQHFADALNADGYRFPAHKAGVRLFDDVRFPAGMSHSEICKMTVLSKLMIGRTNMLGYRQGNTIIPYTAVEIGGLVELSLKRGRQFINRMLQYHVMQRIITQSGPQYYINPAYYMASGNRLSLDLFLLFRDDVKSLLPQWVINDFVRQAQAKHIPDTGEILNQAERIIHGEPVESID